MNKKYQILKVIVGSQAHGTATEDSDTDYRGVYIEPTSQLVARGYKSKGVSWVEGETEDQTSYELANFINLALQGHPNILEMFVAPIKECNEDGKELRDLFVAIWDAEKVYSAFRNYSNNRRKNIFNAENRHVAVKSGYCAIRVLINLIALLKNNSFQLHIYKDYMEDLKAIKEGKWTTGEIIDYMSKLEIEANLALQENRHIGDTKKVEEFYLKMRKKYWE